VWEKKSKFKFNWNYFKDRLNWYFDWSDRTNQDDKLTLWVMGSNPVQVQICDQRSIVIQSPKPNLYFFERSDGTNQDEKKNTLDFFDQRPFCDSRPCCRGPSVIFQKVRQDHHLVQVQKRCFFGKVRQDQSGWNKST